jgi:hypothetical protein
LRIVELQLPPLLAKYTVPLLPTRPPDTVSIVPPLWTQVLSVLRPDKNCSRPPSNTLVRRPRDADATIWVRRCRLPTLAPTWRSRRIDHLRT